MRKITLFVSTCGAPERGFGLRVATARDAATFVDEQTAQRRVGGYWILSALRWNLFQDNQHVGWAGGICFRGIVVLSAELPRSIIVHRRHTYCRSALNDLEKSPSGTSFILVVLAATADYRVGK
jgi:hypothetical protein